jgi:cell division septation protein DedD
MKGKNPNEEQLYGELEAIYHRVAESEKTDEADGPRKGPQPFADAVSGINPYAMDEPSDRPPGESLHPSHRISSRQFEEEHETPRFPLKRILSYLVALAGLAGLAAVAIFVWPTFYSYDSLRSGDTTYRVRNDRVTGKMTYFDNGHWNPLPIPGSPGAALAVARSPQPSSSPSPAAPPPAVAAAPKVQEPAESQPSTRAEVAAEKKEIILREPVAKAGTPAKAAPASGPVAAVRTAKIGKAATAAKPGREAYAIQVRAVKGIEKAEEFVKAHRKEGLNLYWKKVWVEGQGEVYRLLIGSFRSREEASRFLEGRAIRDSFPGSFIQKTSLPAARG